MKTKLINFTKSLIEKKSVTPVDDGAIKLLKKKLFKLGFKNTELLFESKKHEKVLNLFSILKNSKKNSTLYALLDIPMWFPQVTCKHGNMTLSSGK